MKVKLHHGSSCPSRSSPTCSGACICPASLRKSSPLDVDASFQIVDCTLHCVHFTSRNYDAQCASPAPQPSPLFKLPAELIGMLFDAINLLGLGLHTTIALAITCKHMLSVGKPHVLRATRAHWAPWAGCRLICVGSETLPGDLPPGMLTIEEE